MAHAEPAECSRVYATLLHRKVLPTLIAMWVFGCLISAEIAHADNTTAPPSHAVALATDPVFDGVVEGDPAWVNVKPLTNFTQQLPNHGEPATLVTNVYIGYTDEALHIAFIAYEDDIDSMTISNNGWQSDSVLVVIDTYQNQLTGYGFSTNQVGAEWDASIYNGNSNWNWATVWQVKSAIHEDSWSSEMVIPFTSLDYPNRDVQTWGFNFSRFVIGRNEISHWAPIPRQFSIWRLALAGAVDNIKPPPSKRNVKFNPYVITSKGKGRDAELVDHSDFGFDIRYSLSPTLNLTATYNTDFAQVETDRLQINTGRFSLFFPETRPFFLENGQLFSIGVPQETLVFHSRRIGIANDGTRLPMAGGVKLAGHLGLKNEVGLMLFRVDDAATDGYEDFNVARFSRDLGNRSKFGFLATNRESATHDSQSFATDLQWGIGEFAQIRSFVATTQSNDGIAREDEYTYAIYADYASPNWQNSASYHEVGAGFNPSMGFVQRRNSRKIHVASQRSIQMHGKWGLNAWNPHGNYTAYWNFDGYKESGHLHLDSYVAWKNGADMWTAVNVSEEGVRYPFNVAGQQVLPGNYRSPQLSLGINSPRDKSWNIGAALDIGGFYQGDSTGFGIFSNYTQSEHLDVFLNYSYNEVEFPNLDAPFSFSLTRLGVQASFTPKIRLSSLIQYNDADDVLSANLRFSWLRSASTGLYLVYNEINERSLASENVRRSIVFKYSHMFDLNF